MAYRPLRRGSVLVLLIIVIAALGSLLGLHLLWWEQNRSTVQDQLEQVRLQNAAIDVLEQVTAWILSSRLRNPENGTLDPIVVNASGGPEWLEAAVPDGVYRLSADNIEIRLKVQWCRYELNGDLPPENALEWPPALVDYPGGGEKMFLQSFSQTRPDSTGSGNAGFAPWRILLTVLGRDVNGRNRRVVVERLVLAGD